MRLAFAILSGLAFGAADQYLGAGWISNHIGFWTIDISLMSAPWLALPFIFGSAQTRPGPAAMWGLMVTVSALIGYFVMTLSPAEGVSLAAVHPVYFLSSQLHVIVPGLATGPLFGWLGYLWKTSRSRLVAALLAGGFCLEPMVRAAYGQPFEFAGVAAGEIIFGLVLAAYFVRNASTGRRPASRAT